MIHTDTSRSAGSKVRRDLTGRILSGRRCGVFPGFAEFCGLVRGLVRDLFETVSGFAEEGSKEGRRRVEGSIRNCSCGLKLDLIS